VPASVSVPPAAPRHRPPAAAWPPLVLWVPTLLLPLAAVVWVSLAAMGPAGPSWPADGPQMDAWRALAIEPIYRRGLGSSVAYAAAATLLCLAVGFPFANAVASATPRRRAALMVLVIVPLCLPLLVRALAWQWLLADGGTVAVVARRSGVGAALAAAGLVPAPGRLLNSPFSLLIGLTASYLPLMVLPLVLSLARIDRRLLDAAADLGARPWASFWFVKVALARQGIGAGCTLVFVPCVGEVVLPTLLGSPGTPMLGRLIWDELYSNLDWPMAATLTVALGALVALPLLAASRRRGGGR